MPDDIVRLPEEARVVQKIKIVSVRIVRGKMAATKKEVQIYKYQRIATAVIASLGSATLTLKQLPNGQPIPPNSLVWGSVAAFVVILALELYKMFGVEQTAINAIAAGETFRELEVKLDEALEQENPILDLNKVVEESGTFLRNFLKVIPDENESMRQTGEKLANEFVQKHRTGWQFPALREERLG